MIIREETVFKHVSIKKSNLFNKMIEAIEEAGWTNISSRPATDFYVFHSKGEDGMQDLYFQINTAYDTSHINTTTIRYFGARLLSNYIPGETNVAGKATPSNQNWGAIGVSSVERHVDHPFDLYYTANKDRIMFIFEDSYTKGSFFFYVGKPRPTYNKTYPNQGNVMFTYSQYGNSVVYTMGEADTRRTTGHAINADTNGKGTVAFDAAGRIMLHEVVFTSSTGGGFMGYLDGVYAIGNDPRLGAYSMTGDILDIDYKKYRLFYLDAPISGNGWSSWAATSRYLAVRID